MKLATYKDGSRDGQLVVVSRDLSNAHYATHVATRLQQALDDWNFISPQLQDLYQALNAGRARHAFAFEPRRCMAPLPRAFQWVAASAYGRHVELLRRAHGAPPPEGDGDTHGEPPMCRGASDEFLGPCDDAEFESAEWGIDFEAGVAAITGDLARACAPEQALEGVRLLMLHNDWRLRERAGGRGDGGEGIASRPATAFSPVALTPDELGDAWQGGRVHLTLQAAWNGRKVGMCEAGPEMSFHFGQLLAHLAATRDVRAGSIVGSGAVSNLDAAKGYCCIADKRALEAIEHGTPSTGFMRYGDSLRIEIKGRDGASVFGAIEQTVAPPATP